MSRRRNSRDDNDSFSKGVLLAMFAAVIALVALPSAILTYFVVQYGNDIKNHEGRIARLEQKVEDCVDCSQRVREKDRGGYKWRTYESEEVDNAGKVVLGVEIDILSEEYRWECASATTIVKENDKGRSYDLSEIVRQYSPDKELKGAKAIVIVGTASSEGDEAIQEKLAANRIETLTNIVQKNIQEKIPIYGMNFGRYTEGDSEKKCSEDTAAQRRVLIVKVTKQKEGMTEKELGEGLKRRFVALAENTNLRFPIDIRKYSMYRKGTDMLVFGRKNE